MLLKRPSSFCKSIYPIVVLLFEPWLLRSRPFAPSPPAQNAPPPGRNPIVSQDQGTITALAGISTRGAIPIDEKATDW